MAKGRQLDIEKDAPKIGHNSSLNGDEKRKLFGFIDEIVKLEQQRREIATDVSEIYASAKDTGFDVKAMRRVVKARLMTEEEKAKERLTQEAVETYLHALGMLADTPLGGAALRQAVKGLGTPTDLTDEERAKGYSAAFIGRDGTRMAIGADVKA